MKTGAIFSKDRKYRYALTRIWSNKSEEGAKMVTFIGFNPSTADENENDPTITRCINFAKSWGYDGLYMINLFAYVSTSPDELNNDNIDPIGDENDKFIAKYTKNGSFKNRSKEVLSKLNEKYYLALNKTGEPRHPLYVAADTKLTAF